MSAGITRIANHTSRTDLPFVINRRSLVLFNHSAVAAIGQGGERSKVDALGEEPYRTVGKSTHHAAGVGREQSNVHFIGVGVPRGAETTGDRITHGRHVL